MEAWKILKEKKLSRKAEPKVFHQGKSDVFYSVMPIYYFSKVCGLLPVKFSVNEIGRGGGQLHYPQVAYGMLLVLALAGGQLWGLYRDLRDGWQNSTRLFSQTAITVTCSDVFMVIVVTTVAILDSPRRWRHMQQAFDDLVDVDVKLNVTTRKNIRKVSIILISCTMVYLLVISTLDYISWTVSTANKKLQDYDDKGPINYSYLYFMYMVIVTLQMQYAIVLFNVRERFHKINKTIENLTKTNLIIEYFRKDMGLAAQEPRRDILQSMSSSFSSSDLSRQNYDHRANVISDSTVPEEGNPSNSPEETIDLLIKIHDALCNSINEINRGYGVTLLMCTISCLIHLIITLYFLYYDISGSTWYVLSLQVFWTLFHIYKMLLFVQPCYMVGVEARTTGSLVSQALATDWDPKTRKKLERFAMQLLQRPVEFTACGLFCLDRGLMTSIAGAVTTYLVILVQFQSDDGTQETKYLLQNASELLKDVGAT